MRIHIVQKGDTLWNISKKYGVNFEELKAVNTQLSNPDMIMPGMKIKVPQGTKTVKKEAPKKEAPKKEMPSKPPYKDTSPKPIPVIKEDEKKPVTKGVMDKPMMPMQPINMNVPIQMPSIDQQMQNYYTTFHLPQMPMPQAPKEEAKPQKEKEEAIEQPQQYMPAQQQPQQQYCPPMQPQLVHTDFYCCPPHPVMMPAQMPMHHNPHMGMHPYQQMPMHPQQQMPMHYQQPYMPMDGEEYEGESSSMMHGSGGGPDCGCGSDGPQHYSPMMGHGGQPHPGYPPQGQQFYAPQGYMQQPQQPMGGWHPQQGHQQYPSSNWNMPQSMGNWNPQQGPMGNGNPTPWRDDDLDEE